MNVIALSNIVMIALKILEIIIDFYFKNKKNPPRL